MLLDRIGGINRGIRLASDLLCDQCVINRSRQMKLSQSIAGDTKLVQDLLKETVDERYLTLTIPYDVFYFPINVVNLSMLLRRFVRLQN